MDQFHGKGIKANDDSCFKGFVTVQVVSRHEEATSLPLAQYRYTENFQY